MLRKLLFFALALAANSANAQQYPEHPVRVIVGCLAVLATYAKNGTR